MNIDSTISEQPLKLEFSLKIFAVFASVVALAYVTQLGPLFVYLCVAVYATRGTIQAIQALTISWLMLFLNPAIFPKLGSTANLRWVILIISFVVVLQDFKKLNSFKLPQIFRLLLFSASLLMLSLATSIYPVLSILKIIPFTVGAITIILSSYVIYHQNVNLEKWFYNLFVFIIIVSLPLYPTSFGFIRNGRGFQGILNHPQAYGVFIAPILAWLIGYSLWSQNKSKTSFLIIVAGCFSLYVTQARTGVIAIILSLIFTMIFFVIFRKEESKLHLQYLLNPLGIVMVCLTLSLALISFSKIEQYVVLFFTKDAPTIDVKSGFQRSRGFLIEKSMNNFSEFPLTGMGFGTPSNAYSINATVDDLTGILTSAPTEKGFLPSAVLEETGVVGAILFMIFIISFCKPVVAYASLPSVLLFFTCLFVNIGEMVFFSFGGMGLYTWLLMGLALGSANRNRKE